MAVAAGLKRRGVTAISARDAGNLGLSESPQGHWGIVYVHQDKLSIGECIRRLKEIADLFEPDDFKNLVEFL